MVAFAASWAPECAAQVAVFSPGTDKAYMDAVNDRLAGMYPQAQPQSSLRFEVTTRWADGGANGDPITITYSLAPDGLTLPDTIAGPKDPEGPSELFEEFDQRFENDRAWWLFLIDECFEGSSIDSWGRISGITFTRVTGPPVDPDGPGPLPESPVDWDDGSAWGTPGPIGGGGATVGDIRIGAKFIDGPGGLLGYAFPPDHPMYPGEIVLDIDATWQDPSFGYRRLINVMSNLIGIAIGLDLVCPDNDSKIMEPIQDEQDMQGPQLDDIRGVNSLYGDYLENNDELSTDTAIELPFDPVASLLGQQFEFTTLSIDTFLDKDFFYIVVPPELADSEGKVDVDVRIQAIPVGDQYLVGPDNNGACGGVQTETVDASIAQNLRVSLRDAEGNSVSTYFDITGDIVDADAAGYIDVADPGSEELVIGAITTPGTYFVEISSSEAPDPLDPQLYDLFIQVGNTIFSDGMPTDVAVAIPSPNGLGASYITNQPDLGLVPLDQPVYSGRRATIGQIDAAFPSQNHHSLITPDANTPNTRNFAQARVAWPGGATSKPAIGDVSETADFSQAEAIQHATAAANAALGNPEGVYPSGSIGVAYESSLIAASIATRVVPSGFTIERESLTYALFTLTHPTFAAAAGLPTTATVISSPFGFPGDLRGDTYISQLYDAIVYMNRVTAVTGTGNDGGQDNTTECGGGGGNVPGGEFRGSRTATAPGTAFNVIAVGAGAKALPDETPANIDFVNPGIDSISMVPDFSGKGPIDTYNYTTASLEMNTRPGIDFIVPGTGYVLVAKDPTKLDPPAPPCSYLGHLSVISLTSPSLNIAFDGDLDNPNNPDRYSGVAGTSLSSGYAAGATALLQDYALGQNPPLDISPVVIRAILAAGAVPQLGWTNTQNPARPQDNRDGEESIITDSETGDTFLNPALFVRNGTRPLDYAQGAGLLNLETSYSIYRGKHVNPIRDLFVPVIPGTETQDPVQTNPTKPTITDPPRELSDINPTPFGRAQSSTSLSTVSVSDLPPSPLEISKMLFEANADLSDSTIMREHADFGDAKLDGVNPDKNGSGASFTARPPYKLPSNPGGSRPGVNPQAPAPTELASKIIVGPIGWDHGMIGQRIMSLPEKQPVFPTAGPIRTGYIDYFIAFPFDGAENFQCALSWLRTVKMALPNFSNPDDPQIGAITSLELEDLDLELIQCDALGEILEDHVFLGIIGEDGGQIWDGSHSLNNTLEFFSSNPPAGFYVLRVRWIGSNYDLFKNEVDGSVEFGLAWITDFFGGVSLPPDDEGNSAQPRAASSASVVSQAGKKSSTRVMDMMVKSVGSKRGDARFNASFDVDRDNIITVRDFLRVSKFWANR